MTTPRRATRTNKRERALVTSAASGLGRIVCRRLHRTFDVIGVDRVPFPDRPKDVEHHEIDLRRKSATELLRQNRPDVVVHVGGIHGPPQRGRSPRLIDATVQLLKLVESVRARKLVLVSSATLYGASATSANYMTEEAPLLGASNVPDLSDDISLDMMVQSFFWKSPQTETVILRPVHVVGPHIDNLASRYLRAAHAPRLLGFDPMVQIIHEEDLVHALEASLRPGIHGVFNVVGQGQAPLSRLVESRGGKSVPLPGALLRAAMTRAFNWRLSSVDAGELAFLRYSCLVDGSRARDAFGFQPSRSLRATIDDLGVHGT